MENLAPVMALVEPQKWKEVWGGLLPAPYLDIRGDIHLLSCTTAAYYINNWPNPSWAEVYLQLYECNQTDALEKVIPFLSHTSPGTAIVFYLLSVCMHVEQITV